jgi:hypothetical protein
MPSRWYVLRTIDARNVLVSYHELLVDTPRSAEMLHTLLKSELATLGDVLDGSKVEVTIEVR